jgi:hypothetical protein
MKNRGLGIFFGVMVCGLLTGTASWARVPLRTLLPPAALATMGKTILDEHPLLQGEWQDSRSWSGYWCQKEWSYDIKAQAYLSSLDLNVNDDDSMTVTADLSQISADADGTYRSNLTLCATADESVPVSDDGAHLVARVTFQGDGDFSSLQVQVQSAQLQELHLASWVPDYIDSLVTDLTNRALQDIWTTQLGQWIDSYITQYLHNHLPPNN